MEITGTVHKVMPETSGTSANGEWKRQELIIKTMEQYSKSVAIEFAGSKCDQLKSLIPGNTVKIQFHIEAREYNEKWYNKVVDLQLTLIGR